MAAGTVESRLVERTVNIALDDFSSALLKEAANQGEAIEGQLLTRAIRYYLAERNSGRPGWPYSRLFLETEDAKAVEISIDDSTWEAFSGEAERQRVSTDRLLEHATLYYLADNDSGRVAGKIVVDLDGLPPGSG